MHLSVECTVDKKNALHDRIEVSHLQTDNYSSTNCCCCCCCCCNYWEVLKVLTFKFCVLQSNMNV